MRDAFWLARLAAVGAVENHPDPSFAIPLQEAMASETHSEVRLAIVKALRKIQGPLALKTLLEVFLRRTDRVRDSQIHAYQGIREMTGLDYGFDKLTDWEKYYRERFGGAPPAASAAEGGRAPSVQVGPPSREEERKPPAEREAGK